MNESRRVMTRISRAEDEECADDWHSRNPSWERECSGEHRGTVPDESGSNDKGDVR